MRRRVNAIKVRIKELQKAHAKATRKLAAVENERKEARSEKWFPLQAPAEEHNIVIRRPDGTEEEPDRRACFKITETGKDKIAKKDKYLFASGPLCIPRSDFFDPINEADINSDSILVIIQDINKEHIIEGASGKGRYDLKIGNIISKVEVFTVPDEKNPGSGHITYSVLNGQNQTQQHSIPLYIGGWPTVKIKKIVD